MLGNEIHERAKTVQALEIAMVSHPDVFFELILGTLFGSRSYQTYSANISTNSYEPGFKARLGLKDLRLATEAASRAGRQLPMLDAVRERMRETVDAGMGDKDWSAMADYTINQSK
jgi:3-hydroxyisobutyrate dehydrogenase-like beta-hydroxyacid dehydrogenase